ncbi:hydroxyethylthiazole kinase [Rhodobacteraceae bacterium RKSG542]|nr:hydroxyethylthiazole kinase [Pseudovibrio flavus]
MQERTVRVHCLTNLVAQSFTANTLLACRAVPSMTISPEEVADFTASSGALLVNLGTLDAARKGAMLTAVSTAKANGVPWVIDPVLVERSPTRCQFAHELLRYGPDAVRCNKPELDALALERHSEHADKTVVACTGAIDRISFGAQPVIELSNGHPFMAQVTAMGCALGAVMAASVALVEDRRLAVAGALAFFSVAGELAGRQCSGPGSFPAAFLDQLYSISFEDFSACLNYRQVSNPQCEEG